MYVTWGQCMIACVDVDYRDVGAVAACARFQAWSDDTPASKTVVQISNAGRTSPASSIAGSCPGSWPS